jgi:uracil-DNA glycosylase
LLDLFELIPPSWQRHLAPYRESLAQISSELHKREISGEQIIPEEKDIFRVLKVRPEQVRVVIVGQDPYPNPLHAIGRAFAVPNETVKLPGSLRNIFKERRSDVGGSDPLSDLTEWEKQGVLLLNSVLTVTEGSSNSHQNLGWQRITERIVELAANRGAVGVLWGNHAATFKHFFSEKIVMGAHPSPLSAHRGFFGSRPFSRTNDLLDEPIIW